MTWVRLARGRKLVEKIARLIPQLIAHPRLLWLTLRGVHPEHYQRLNVAWIRTANIQTVLDIGANNGQFTLAIHCLLPDAMIYAFEPLPDCYTHLAKRFAMVPNVRVLHTALGDDDGEVVFHQNEFSQSSSVLPITHLHRQTFPWAAKDVDIRVPLHRLDSLVSEMDLTNSILIKIDVQGYEDRVLRGGMQVIQAADYVLVETSFERLYEGEASFSKVYDVMTGYGFRYAGNLDQVASSIDGRVLYADALFVRAGNTH